jgi:hypothetical protein
MDNLYNFFKIVVEKFQIVEYFQKNLAFSDLEDLFTLFGFIKSAVTAKKDLDLKGFMKKI